MKDNDLECDTLYGSNIREWLRQGAPGLEDPMVENMKAIMSPITSFIDAKRDLKISGSPKQRVTQGDVPNLQYARPQRTRRDIDLTRIARKSLFDN